MRNEGEGQGSNEGYERGWQAVGWIQGVECTKLGLRPSNRAKRATEVVGGDIPMRLAVVFEDRQKNQSQRKTEPTEPTNTRNPYRAEV